MYNTFNMGIGLAICVKPKDVDKTIEKLSELGEQAVVFATIEKGEGVFFV
jgi:phosphoribosylformylglycinamidine cyclo-ligase